MKFEPHTLDYDLSPYTGLTRESWLEAGEYLLAGIFQNIQNFEDPVTAKRTETEITYPHLDAPAKQQESQRKAEVFEGLCRSFFIAAPLIHDNPELTVCGYRLRDYYKNQVLRVCTPSDPLFVGTYEDLMEMTGSTDPSRTFQQTVETCALVICLWIVREELWNTYSGEEKDTIADFLLSFAHASTVPQNWRLFNMLDMAFLHNEGYPIDRGIMAEHAQAILNYYVGDGWYRDGQCFDYYSCWAFNVYAPLWNLWYGYENEPVLARKFEENSNRLMETYGDFFDEEGYTNMWGRSNIYRNAATSAFSGNLCLRHSAADHGLARRIASGSLMQFLGREDFLARGIPSLGFYGQFSPLVQGYSCAESPFWLGKAFLSLYYPKEHPFWSARENNGSWERLKDKEVKETVLSGPALCFTNHKANGETVLRTGKVVKAPDDLHGMWNYSKLCYNTKYPWEATPTEGMGEVEAQQYVLKEQGRLVQANATFWCGEKEGVLYRRQFFGYNLGTEMHWIQAMNLADFPVPCGILRVDKLRLIRWPVSVSLGSYGFPDNGTQIEERTLGDARAVILKGKDFTGREKQMAMTVYDGWDEISTVESTGSNPDSEKSVVIYAETARNKQYGGLEPYLLISQVITKESWEDFSEAELFPIERIEYEDGACVGAYGTTTIHLKSGEVRKVNFEGIEAGLSL